MGFKIRFLNNNLASTTDKAGKNSLSSSNTINVKSQQQQFRKSKIMNKLKTKRRFQGTVFVQMYNFCLCVTGFKLSKR